MNSPDPDDPALLARARNLPRPVLSAEARRRSLAAALAALEEPPLAPSPPRRRILRMGQAQLCGLAACWAVIGYFHFSAPGTPEHPGTVPAAGYTAWPGSFHAAPDAETAQLLATLYPARRGDQRAFLPAP